MPDSPTGTPDATLTALTHQAPVALYVWRATADGLEHAWTSPSLTAITGQQPPDTTDALWWLSSVHPDDRERVHAAHPRPYVVPHQVLEFRFRHVQGHDVWIRDEKRLRTAEDGGVEVLGAWSDVTSHVRFEEQARRVQKLEAVGRLAGRIAHDFNNLLTVICGSSDLLLMDRPESDPDRALLGEIHQAGQRAVALTQHLLAFSRKQVLDPRVVDLNLLVSGADRAIRQVLGAGVRVSIARASHPVVSEVDPGQVEQVLLRLAENARDAMPEGGEFRIRTGRFHMTDEFCRMHPGSRTGHYATLAVGDTGCGMTREVRAHLFEPFFTTKPPGRGTGLGLAMVFGFVKQSEGYIDVRSEPGTGTEFTLYFPAPATPASRAPSAAPPAIERRGRETVLLVEDEQSVRKLTRRALGSYGYHVLEAASGAEALDIVAREPAIQLVISDVVMPGMSGVELAQQLASTHPAIKVLFVSGYIDDDLVRHGVVEGEHAFLQKPFPPATLAARVRDLLDRG